MDLRKSSMSSQNKGRIEPKFVVGGYVLVHKDRWPQKKLKKVKSQWFGPFQILEVRHGSLKIAASPSLGGEVLVAISQVKHWHEILDHDQEFQENEFSPNDQTDDLVQDDVMSEDDEDVREITQDDPMVESGSPEISQSSSNSPKCT